MVGKFVYLLAFLVSIAAVAHAEPGYGSGQKNGNISHNLIVGSREPRDRLYLKHNVIKASKWMQVVTVEQVFAVAKYQRITQLRALDQKINGNGANASLLQGGPGHNNVTLRFKSKRGHGINFVVELYALP